MQHPHIKISKYLIIFFLALPAFARAETLFQPININPETKCMAADRMTAEDCQTADQGCRNRYGAFSYFSGRIEEDNNVCECRTGYVWNGVRTKCIPTACPDDMVYYSPYRGDDGWFLDGRCLKPDAVCQSEYGEGAISVETTDSGVSNIGDGASARDAPVGRLYGETIACACAEGYAWSADETACQAKPVVAGIELSAEELDYIEIIEREKAAVDYWDDALIARLAGRTLIQVEDKGRAWYLDPVTRFRHYLASPAKAFTVMRERGLGARHEFIAKYKKYPKEVWGKILIDVDDLGKAYYIDPVDGLGYYLGTPEMAIGVMRRVGLGVSNGDLRKIPVAQNNSVIQ